MTNFIWNNSKNRPEGEISNVLHHKLDKKLSLSVIKRKLQMHAASRDQMFLQDAIYSYQEFGQFKVIAAVITWLSYRALFGALNTGYYQAYRFKVFKPGPLLVLSN